MPGWCFSDTLSGDTLDPVPSNVLRVTFKAYTVTLNCQEKYTGVSACSCSCADSLVTGCAALGVQLLPLAHAEQSKAAAFTQCDDLFHIAMQVLRLVCSCLRNAPASDAWDLSSLLVNGSPVSQSTVTAVLSALYSHLGALGFKPPTRRAVQPGAAAGHAAVCRRSGFQQGSADSSS